MSGAIELSGSNKNYTSESNDNNNRNNDGDRNTAIDKTHLYEVKDKDRHNNPELDRTSSSESISTQERQCIKNAYSREKNNAGDGGIHLSPTGRSQSTLVFGAGGLTSRVRRKLRSHSNVPICRAPLTSSRKTDTLHPWRR